MPRKKKFGEPTRNVHFRMPASLYGRVLEHCVKYKQAPTDIYIEAIVRLILQERPGSLPDNVVKTLPGSGLG